MKNKTALHLRSQVAAPVYCVSFVLCQIKSVDHLMLIEFLTMKVITDQMKKLFLSCWAGCVSVFSQLEFFH